MHLAAQGVLPAQRCVRTGGVEKELTRRESEPREIIYFKLYKSQIPVIEQAMKTAALMLGPDKSRGYCLEMICGCSGYLQRRRFCVGWRD